MPGRRIHITGVVQGVGFRPFVYREAVARAISGWVLNAGDGVHVEAWADDAEALDAFTRALREHAPAAARVDSVEAEDLPEGVASHEAGFTIRASDADTAETTLVSPDIATCPACVRELFDPADRRYHYPFINCTDCGPRFTIIRSLPYDRPATSMSGYPMCEACTHEYADPADRRFHAQPDACFDCGPHITWRERCDGTGTIVGDTREGSDAIIARCAELLATGGIVAIKGLGGFHLACDAGADAAVRELRRRKRRSNKPLAVMVRDIGGAEALCCVNEAERALLTGSVRPIVLLRRRRDGNGSSVIAPAVADDLPELGVMLPYTPLQHLLLAACGAVGVGALVMTSGNLSEEPIEIDDAAAWKHLVGSGIADALLGNDRPILSRYDDSVVRVVAGHTMPVRRARGYAPLPLPLPRTGDDAREAAPIPSILACGPEQKATVAVTREDPDQVRGFVSQHIGDVENGGTFSAWREAEGRLERLFDLHPTAIACDLHPSYLPSQWARERARELSLPLFEVQHHHAHIASVIAEASARGDIDPAAAVIGIALDGTGAGTDGTVWGGEFLIATLGHFERVGYLACWHLPGSAASVRDARRNALSLLIGLGLTRHAGAADLLNAMDATTRQVTETMVERGINSPLTSSMGRLLDALAALTGICGKATYEGEPAIQLEAAAQHADGDVADRDAARYRLAIIPDATQQHTRDGAPMTPTARHPTCDPFVLDAAPLVTAVLDDLVEGVDRNEVARRIHAGICRSITDAAVHVSGRTGIRTVALSGGVWMNRLLLEGVTEALAARGLAVLVPTTVPVNDGCIAYGQAAVAHARLTE